MNLRQWLVCATLLLASGWAAAQNKVVYHFTDSATQGLAGLRNLRNHLDIEPSAQIIVVAHGQGVDFLMEGAKDKAGSAFAGPVSALKGRGVRFEVCEITLKARDLSKDQFLQEVDFTPSGVVRASKLQHEGYAYIKP
ncbi:DsrE family protein [Roseateles oligotrophus]|uniref:DsrE family protein n=1 Tax=Roseateles oligotrophus TaxID=1769250 RepID=A0ABT2YLT1_9BURK|nr:DsrE family protein [Roseateles oligotrophus]MCV2371028.1 DsrE family protein [Roseateles oligotrophus]